MLLLHTLYSTHTRTNKQTNKHNTGDVTCYCYILYTLHTRTNKQTHTLHTLYSTHTRTNKQTNNTTQVMSRATATYSILYTHTRTNKQTNKHNTGDVTCYCYILYTLHTHAQTNKQTNTTQVMSRATATYSILYTHTHKQTNKQTQHTGDVTCYCYRVSFSLTAGRNVIFRSTSRGWKSRGDLQE